MSEKNVSDKLDKVIEDLTEIKIVLGRHETYHEVNTRSLEEHIKRTRLAEERIEMLHQADIKLSENISSKIEPIQKHVDKVELILWGIGIAASIIGLITALGYKLF